MVEPQRPRTEAECATRIVALEKALGTLIVLLTIHQEMLAAADANKLLGMFGGTPKEPTT